MKGRNIGDRYKRLCSDPILFLSSHFSAPNLSATILLGRKTKYRGSDKESTRAA